MKKSLPKIILSSKSPRRETLLRAMGIEFQVHPSEVDEETINARTPREFALKAAYLKAVDVAKHYVDAVIIAADTVVVIDNDILGKPDDEHTARDMLQRLSGRSHFVITGLALCDARTGACLMDAVTTEVFFHTLSEREINDYIKTGDPFDKAGAYGIQSIGERFVERIEGDYNNVVGLPTDKLAELLRSFLS